MPVDIKQIYRDCNAASHYLKEALTTKPRKGPLRGKFLVNYSFFIQLVIYFERYSSIERFKLVHCSCIACDLLKMVQYFCSATILEGTIIAVGHQLIK